MGHPQFLLTAALILALVTSLTAGTMAYYNIKVDTMTQYLTTKTFVFTADQKSNTFNQNVKIAPGDTVKYEITLTNASEVSIESTLAAELKNSMDGMTVSVERLDSASGNSTDVVTADDGKKSTATTEMLVPTSVGKSSDTYVITISWDYGSKLTNDATKATQGQSVQLTVDINGQQRDEDITTAADGTASVAK